MVLLTEPIAEYNALGLPVIAHRRTHRPVTKIFSRTSSLRIVLGAVFALAAIAVPLFSAEAEDEVVVEQPTGDIADAPQRPQNLSLSDFDPEQTRLVAVNAADDAIAAAAASSLGTRRLPETTRDYLAVLENTAPSEGSVSLGTIRDGALVNAATLSAEGHHYEIIETHRSRHTNYGTEELVDAIERASRKVADEHGGAPLRVGNLGYHRGGSIPWSNSHEAGRDADIAFYSLDDEGRSVPTPGLITFDDDGLAHNGELRFDVPRNWTLVRALLTDPDIAVQWLFVSEGLKFLLIKHAIEIEEDPEIIERAIHVLHQPTDAPPHDDHLHLRIGCSEADRLAGCVDWGPQWEWHDWHEPALFARTRKMQRAFDNPAAEIRKEALAYLQDIRSPFAPEVALHHGLSDPDDDVRSRALELIEDIPLRSDAGVHLLEEAMDGELNDDEREALYNALRRAHSERAAGLAMRRYRDEELDDDERAMAIDALAHRVDSTLIPKLIDAIESESSPQLRERLARQLYRNAARSDGVDWGVEATGDEHAEALEEWRMWWEDEPDRHRILEDFVARRGAEQWKDLEAIDDLIPRLRDAADWERYNLNRIISDWTGRWAPREWGDDHGAYRFWTNWWDRNRDRVLNPRPTPWDDWER